ncbi:MAG: ABC transporter permease [Desulfobacteraceae bacterium]
MTIVALTPMDLATAAGLIVLLVLLSWRMHLGLVNQLLVAALRTTVQLMLIGIVLNALFAHVHLGWMALMAAVMLLAASREVMGRQKRRFCGWWGFGMGALSMFLSSFTVTILALNVIIAVDPWYAPRYAIPLLGMLLGNTMNGIAIGLDRLTATAWDQRTVLHHQRHGGRRPGQSSRDDDRSDPWRQSSHGGCLVPDIDHVPDIRRHRPGDSGGRMARFAASVRRKAAAEAGSSPLTRVTVGPGTVHRFGTGWTSPFGGKHKGLDNRLDSRGSAYYFSSKI